MKEQIHEDPKIVAAAERQMRAWEMTESREDRVARQKNIQHLAGQLHPFLTISREVGSGGHTVAEMVGRRLGWEVLGKELLDRIASRFHNNRMMLDLVDETPSNWVYDVLGTWMDSKIVTHDTYVVQLGRVVLAAAKTAPAIFVGRGVQFLLPREKGFSVRLVASAQFRQENLMRLKGMTSADAQRYIHEMDQGRREFCRRFFHNDITDPHLYNLVINTERLGMEESADLIYSAMTKRLLA